MRFQAGFLFVVMLTLTPADLAAQDSLVRATIDSGTLIRMHPAAGSPVRGRLIQPLRPSSTVVLFCRSPAPPCNTSSDSAAFGQVPTSSLDRLEVQRGSHWPIGAAIGGVVGLVIGGLAEALASMDCNESGSCPTGGVILGVSTVLFGAMGAFVGSGSPKWGPAP